MQQNMQASRIALVWKKIEPTIVRAVNNIVYFIFGVIKSVFRGIMDQFKGK